VRRPLQTFGRARRAVVSGLESGLRNLNSRAAEILFNGKVAGIQDVCRSVGSAEEAVSSEVDASWQVKEAEFIRRAAPDCLSESEAAQFDAATLRYQNGRELTVPPVRCAVLRNWAVGGSDPIIRNHDGRILFESAMCQRAILDANVWNLLSKPRCSAEVAILLATPWSTYSYYHWLVDALPRLLYLPDDLLARFKLIIPQAPKRFHIESLRSLNLEMASCLELPSKPTKFGVLVFPELLAPTGSISVDAIRRMRERFAVGFERPTKNGRRIYVCRRDTKRRVVNEAELLRVLERRGFDVICPGELSLSEQIRVFSDAAIVVGPHGAGFTNMIFAPRGSTLIELFGSSYVNGCFWALSNAIGQRHMFSIAPTSTLDMQVDVNAVLALVDRAEEEGGGHGHD
jgi:hypothetical protein